VRTRTNSRKASSTIPRLALEVEKARAAPSKSSSITSWVGDRRPGNLVLPCARPHPLLITPRARFLADPAFSFTAVAVTASVHFLYLIFFLTCSCSCRADEGGHLGRLWRRDAPPSKSLPNILYRGLSGG